MAECGPGHEQGVAQGHLIRAHSAGTIRASAPASAATEWAVDALGGAGCRGRGRGDPLHPGSCRVRPAGTATPSSVGRLSWMATRYRFRSCESACMASMPPKATSRARYETSGSLAVGSRQWRWRTRLTVAQSRASRRPAIATVGLSPFADPGTRISMPGWSRTAGPWRIGGTLGFTCPKSWQPGGTTSASGKAISSLLGIGGSSSSTNADTRGKSEGLARCPLWRGRTCHVAGADGFFRLRAKADFFSRPLSRRTRLPISR